MTNIKLIGISGTNGSGKDSLGHMLAERYGWLFVPATDILRTELQGLPIERENLRNLGNEWRREYGAGVLIDKSVGLYNRGDYKGLAIASIRSEGEAERIHELGGSVVWVDANARIRYERINGRGRGAEDNKTFEIFLSEQQIEMDGGDDKTGINMAAIKAKADIFLENNGDDIEKFKNDAEKALKNYL
jgi:cytidylate kinase